MSQPHAPALDAQGIHKSYGTHEVLRGVDLLVEPGQILGLLGRNGAGKSTLVKLIARFYDLTSGSLTLDGVELRELSQADLRRNVVMVTQEAFLFSGSIAENIALGRPDATEAEIQAYVATGEPLPMTEVVTLCAQCHGPQYRDFKAGAHGGMTGYWDLSRGDRTRNNCVSCHDPHSPKYAGGHPVMPPRNPSAHGEPDTKGAPGHE